MCNNNLDQGELLNNEVIISEPLENETSLQTLDEQNNNDSKENENQQIFSMVTDLKNNLIKIEDILESKIKYDNHKNTIIDKLHNELQEYKGDLVKKLLQPVLSDIIMLIDDTRKLCDSYNGTEPGSLDPAKILKQMKMFPSDLEDILFRQGIESFTHNEDTFNPSFQKAIKVIETDEKEKEKKIAKRLRNGYTWDGKVFRQELVEVFVYKQIIKEKTNEISEELKNNE